MANSRGVVIAALIANGLIAILKFVGYLLTASPSMLSETYHSISDTGNQVFLLIGIRFGERDRSRKHPFGYGKAQFFYAFLVSVLLFGIAGWESLKHGYHALTAGGGGHASGAIELLGFVYRPPAWVSPFWVNVTVLLAAIAFETYALGKAYKEMDRQMTVHEWSGLREAFRKTSDVTTLTALTEDAIAMAGAGIALIGLVLTEVTGIYLFDAAAAAIIGLLLMGFAVALAWENKRLLLGESLAADEERRLRTIIDESADVESVVDFRTVYFGPEDAIVTADVRFAPGLDTKSIDERITAIEAALRDASHQLTKVYIEPER